MWDDECYEGKSLLTSASTSKLGLSISKVITNWLESLPDEIIPNILITLPVKSLIRFTSVCKSWESTIKNPKFIHTHLTHTLNSNDQNDTHLILFHNVHSKLFFHYPKYKEASFSLHYDNTAAVTEYCKIEFPVAIKEEVRNDFRVVGTCNGLVLLADDLEDYGYTFVVWNPSIRRYVTLPKSTMRFSTQGTYVGPVGLGYDAVGNDYKVVRLTTLFKKENPCRPDNWPTSCEVYSLAKGTWSTVSPPQCIVLQYSAAQVFINGALHWMAKHCHWIDEMVHMDSFILTFDVAAESFGEIMLPKGFELEEAPLSTLSDSGDRKSIALFANNEVSGAFFLEYWVMKEYSEEKSWTKLLVFGPHDRWINVPRVLCFRRSGEVMLLLKDGHIVSLDIVSEEFKHLGMYGGDLSSVHSYEESLVLLERKDAVSY